MEIFKCAACGCVNNHRTKNTVDGECFGCGGQVRTITDMELDVLSRCNFGFVMEMILGTEIKKFHNLEPVTVSSCAP